MLRRDTNRTWFALAILLLCFCVMMQMLGVPITLWNPSEMDTSGENLGFSIPPTIPQLNLSILLTRLQMSQQILHPPLLLHTVFHPPKSPQ
jgi:hypothetical protein